MSWLSIDNYNQTIFARDTVFNLVRYSTLLFVIFALVGCTTTVHYKPKASTFKIDSISEFLSNKSVSLNNNQSSTLDVLVLTNGRLYVYGNLNEWTNSAIDITQRELVKRNMAIDEGATKMLKLSIETAKGTPGTWVIRCETRLRVETGEGYVNTYIGDNRSPATIYRAADGAVMRAVANMLRDPKIIDYLKK